MTFDEKFLQAVLIRPPKVLGVQLRPYCAGHALILDALSNPFVCDDGDWSAEALGLAVLVCSRSFEEARRLLVPRGRGTRLCIRTRFLLWRLGRRAYQLRHRLSHEFMTFAEYLADYQELPDYWEHKSSGSLAAPWPYSAAVGAVVALKGALSLSEAWNLPLSEASFYGATVGDLYGDEDLMSARDKAGMQAVKDGSWRRKRKTEDSDALQRPRSATAATG